MLYIYSIHPSINLSIHSSFHLISMPSSIYPSILLFIHSYFLVSIHISINLYIYTSNYLSNYPSIHLSIYPSIYIYIYSSIYQPVYSKLVNSSLQNVQIPLFVLLYWGEKKYSLCLQWIVISIYIFTIGIFIQCYTITNLTLYHQNTKSKFGLRITLVSVSYFFQVFEGNRKKNSSSYVGLPFTQCVLYCSHDYQQSYYIIRKSVYLSTTRICYFLLATVAFFVIIPKTISIQINIYLVHRSVPKP